MVLASRHGWRLFYLLGCMALAIPIAAQGPTLTIVADNDFQREVLEKLGRLEVKIDTLVGDSQPGRMSLAEARLTQLERNDIRRAFTTG
jgi:hypothetical protein